MDPSSQDNQPPPYDDVFFESHANTQHLPFVPVEDRNISSSSANNITSVTVKNKNSLENKAPPAYSAENVENVSAKVDPSVTIIDVKSNKDENENKAKCGLIRDTLWLLIFSAIPIAMIIIGIKTLHKCRTDEHIPIYLILSGAVTIVYWFLCGCLSRTVKYYSYISNVLLFGSGFLQGWASISVFSKWNKYKELSDNKGYDMDKFCNPTAFLFAFSVLLIYWILCFVALSICIIGKCNKSSKCASLDDPEES